MTLSPQALQFLLEMCGSQTKASGPWAVARILVEIEDAARAELEALAKAKG